MVFNARHGGDRILPVDLVYFRDEGLIEIQSESHQLLQALQNPPAFFRHILSDESRARHIAKKGGAASGTVGLWNCVHRIDSDGKAHDAAALMQAAGPYPLVHARVFAV